MTPHMQALTLVEFALGNVNEDWARRNIPGLDRVSAEDLENIGCLVQKDWRQDEATQYAERVLATLRAGVTP